VAANTGILYTLQTAFAEFRRHVYFLFRLSFCFDRCANIEERSMKKKPEGDPKQEVRASAPHPEQPSNEKIAQLEQFKAVSDDQALTTNQGVRIADNQNS